MKWLKRRKNSIYGSLIFIVLLCMFISKNTHWINTSAYVDFKVASIEVIGNHILRDETILNHIGLKKGQVMSRIDPAQIYAQLKAYSWIKEVSVRRIFPTTVVIELEECEPMWIWQNKGQFLVLDRFGKPLLGLDPRNYMDLFHVTGEGANEMLASLAHILSHFEDLNIISAAWVGNRRWTLYVLTGLALHLPEDKPYEALKKWQILHHYFLDAIADPKVMFIDMRVTNQIRLQGEKDWIN
jgi:cell division protein FtsQ